MDREILERLAMDRALGELTPDAEALWTAYVERDAAAQVVAHEVTAVIGAARGALADEEDAQALPPLPRGTRRAMTRVVWVAALGAGMAACLAAGFFVGRAAAPPDALAGTTGPAPRSLVQVGGPVAPVAAGAGVQDFWSAERLRAYAAESNRAPRRPDPSIPAMFFKNTGG